jgi:hypothetical protein
MQECDKTSEEPAVEILSARKQKQLRRSVAKKLHLESVKAALLAEANAAPPKPPPADDVGQAGGGKAYRARMARRGLEVTSTKDDHIAAGDPCPADPDGPHGAVIDFLERMETQERLLYDPGMLTRCPIPTDLHGSMIASSSSSSSTHPPPADPTIMACHPAVPLRALPPFSSTLAYVLTLDLSSNELWDLPPLSNLPNLRNLDISRNWFRTLPTTISTALSLATITASHNVLRSSASSLLVTVLQSLPDLHRLDLTFNQNVNEQKTLNMLRASLPGVDTILCSINSPRVPDSMVGQAAADRDANLLRSQLEPWNTAVLRRRIVADFGCDVLGEEVGRGGVMKKLLDLYGERRRKRVKVEGTPVDPLLLEVLEKELKLWSDSFKGGNSERTSIKAEHYTILTAPLGLNRQATSKSSKAAAKLAANRVLWDAAADCLRSVNPDFQVSAVAVTHNFTGSPHIDRQNTGPFAALSVGSFADGEGCVNVECSARVVGEVNTKGRVGMIDGRKPHWVGDYAGERWSVIFYQTEGVGEKVGPSVFTMPVECCVEAKVEFEAVC